jgi:TolB-like protein
MKNKTKNIRKLTAIMFTDIVGYTAMMQSHEEYAKRIRDKHRDVLQTKIQKRRGNILQFYGDGTLSAFDSAIEAVLCAKEIQRELTIQPTIPLRIGIHVGDIVHDEDGIYGDGVNVASRIESLGVPGSVLISEKIHDELTNHPTLKSVSLGSYDLKNVKTPTKIFALSGDGVKVPTRDELKQQANESTIKKSIAVLPFINLSADSKDDYFADGIAEEIMNGLNRLEGIAVTSRSSSFAFRGKTVGIKEIGHQLNVSFILEGSVRKDKENVRVMIRLINAADEYQLWSEVYDGKITSVFSVQDEVARNVVNRMKENLDSENSKTRIVKSTTKNI